jgi:hypothetical protein
MKKLLILVVIILLIMYIIINDSMNRIKSAENFDKNLKSEEIDPKNTQIDEKSKLLPKNKSELQIEKPIPGKLSRVTILNQDNDVKRDWNPDKELLGKCDGKCGVVDIFPVLDPEFNMRETAKQCLLLEDHLNNKKKRCLDCIRKHFLIIDGFLEEAVSLEKDNVEKEKYRELFRKWIEFEKEYAINFENSDNLDNISKKIRSFRKPLVEKYFNNVKNYNTSSTDVSAIRKENIKN